MLKRYVQTLAALATLVGALATTSCALLGRHTGSFDNQVHQYRAGEAAVLFSGDAGFLAFGLSEGPRIAKSVETLGLPVYSVSSYAEFKTRRTIPETVAIVDEAVRAAMAKYHAQRVLLVGQSFGADVVGVALPDLAPDVRKALLGVVLIVPTHPVYLKADPTSLSYRGRPDASTDRARSVTNLPILCVYGLQESDSLCPTLTGRNVTVVGLPGGHELHRDIPRLRQTLAMGTMRMLEAPKP